MNYKNSTVTTNAEVNVDKDYKHTTQTQDRSGAKELNSDDGVGAHSFDVKHPEIIDAAIKSGELKKLKSVTSQQNSKSNTNTDAHE